MLALHEFVLVITLHRTVRHADQVNEVNELHRTYEACVMRGQEIDRVVKLRHTWTCRPVDQD